MPLSKEVQQSLLSPCPPSWITPKTLSNTRNTLPTLFLSNTMISCPCLPKRGPINYFHIVIWTTKSLSEIINHQWVGCTLCQPLNYKRFEPGLKITCQRGSSELPPAPVPLPSSLSGKRMVPYAYVLTTMPLTTSPLRISTHYRVSRKP